MPLHIRGAIGTVLPDLRISAVRQGPEQHHDSLPLIRPVRTVTSPPEKDRDAQGMHEYRSLRAATECRDVYASSSALAGRVRGPEM